MLIHGLVSTGEYHGFTILDGYDILANYQHP